MILRTGSGSCFTSVGVGKECFVLGEHRVFEHVDDLHVEALIQLHQHDLEQVVDLARCEVGERPVT